MNKKNSNQMLSAQSSNSQRVYDKVAHLEKKRLALDEKLMEQSEKITNLGNAMMIKMEQEIGLRLKAEYEKKAQEDLLIQQNKMAAVGEMISIIAHQLKQPLSAISMIISSVSYMDSLPDKLRESLVKIEKDVLEHVHFMSGTISGFRDFLMPTKNMTSFSPSVALDEFLKLFKKQFVAANIKITITIKDEFSISGHSNEFKHVLLNLFSNSKDAIKEGGAKGGKIEVEIEKNDQMGLIKIRDSGGGIPEELLPTKLFEVYISTKGENGTGIGLYLTKVIVERMGGSISASNTKTGAEFVISIPLSAGVF